MRTYHATATVRNGQLVLAEPLPQELEGHQLECLLQDMASTELATDAKIAILRSMAAKVTAPPISAEALRRVNHYDDDEQDKAWVKPSEEELRTLMGKIHELTKGTPSISIESLRRVNLYDDDGKC